ncbi:zinc-binding dehydrogenase [Cryptosporangium sp. NPDC048952]|uniref:zinc-dependent alcohol dehydrogenase n=1 Tax=Cryptosporangium sp. NPDC048952 TaxID=3363961 RepID=UPI00371D6CE7
MRTLVYQKPNVAEIVDRDPPAIGPSDVLVRMRAVGICHSDFDLLTGNYILPIRYPVVPGHEWTGDVAEVGSAVTGFTVGDRVVGECSVADDEHFGFTYDGALSEYFPVPAAWLHKLPENVGDSVGALVEPFTVAYGATRGFDASDTVAVFGAGPIGLCSTAAAAAMGARTIIVEPDPARRELAAKLGAEHSVDPTAGDVVEQILELTGGRGADGVVEASGNPRAMADTLLVAAYNGRIVNVGINVGGEQATRLGLIVEKSLNIRGQVGSTGVTWDAVLRFLGRLPVDLSQIISRRFDFEDSLDALTAAEDRKSNIKIHIHNPNLDA